MGSIHRCETRSTAKIFATAGIITRAAAFAIFLGRPASNLKLTEQRSCLTRSLGARRLDRGNNPDACWFGVGLPAASASCAKGAWGKAPPVGVVSVANCGPDFGNDTEFAPSLRE